MIEEIRTDLDLAQIEQQDAEAYARQLQDPAEIADWESSQDWEAAGEVVKAAPTLNDKLPEDFRLWLAKCDALAADILARREGRPLDLDALLQADRADLEARDEYVLRGSLP